MFHIVSESLDESHLLESFEITGANSKKSRVGSCCVDAGPAPESGSGFLLSSQGRYPVAVPVPAEAQHVTDFWISR